MNLFRIWASGSGGDVVLKFLSGALEALLFSEAKPLKEGIMGNIHVMLSKIWTSGKGGDVV